VVNDVMNLELLAVLAALLLLFLGAVVATRRAPTEYAGDDLHGWNELARELDRSRRFGRKFSLIRIPRPGGATEDVIRGHLERIGRALRSIDHAWMSDSGLYVLLPETDRMAANTLGTRLLRTSPELLPENLAIVSFPDDGITSGALLSALDEGPKAEGLQPIPGLVSAITGNELLTVRPAEAPSVELTDDRGR
jgi:hypothetical protein